MTETKTTGMANGLQMRINDADQRLIKSTFRGNDALFTLLRKIFLPELDPNVQLGQMVDLWLTLDNINKDASLEEQIVNLKARNLLISHLDQCLLTLKLNADKPDEEAKLKISSNK